MITRSRRFPAEWEPQDGVLFVWPKPDSGWDYVYDDVVDDFAQLVATVLRYEAVILCIDEDDSRQAIESRILSKRIPLFPLHFVVLPGNDSWARDFGPIGIKEDGQTSLLNFVFNGWGEKHPSTLDNRVSDALAGTLLTNRMINSSRVLEGGSIETNGAGTLLTTRRCLMEQHRNPDMAEEDYEAFFKQYLGISQVHWLDNGWLAGDDTDGHIDMLARFVDKNTILYTACQNQDDEHYSALTAMEEELRELRDASGNAYRLVGLPFPDACYSAEGERLPASYANFLIINDAVLCPTYEVAQDSEALDLLVRHFPGRAIEPIPARSFIHQGGSVHCLSMQLPRGSMIKR